MPILARPLVAAALVLLGTTAEAAPPRRAAAKLVHETPTSDDVIAIEQPDDDDDDDDDEADEADESDADTDEADEAPVRKHAKRKRARQAFEDGERDLDDSELVDVAKPANRRARDWYFAIGPNAWLASVQANVAVGAKEVTAAIDFLQISRQTKFALPLLAEGRYRRFSFVGDLMYGLIGLSGGNDVGPLTLQLSGKVSSVQFDGIGGYRVLGSATSKLAVEGRAGVRYQRMAISGTVDLSGNAFAPKQIVDTSADFLAGARVFVRPWQRLFVTGTIDQSLFGSSTSTWSAGADANLAIGSHVLLNAGYRTMTQQKDTISTRMFGPKVSLQIMF